MIQELKTGILDINNKYNINFSCKQLDDIILKIILYDKSLPADLSNYNVRLKAFKADQVPLIQNTNITIKDNLVTIKADKQLTTTNGIVKAELQFINKTTLEKKSTFYINIEVVASVLDVDGVVSTPTCTLLEEIDNKLDQIENIGEVLDQAKEVRDTLTNTTIPGATNINSKLENNINNASTKITEVKSIISSASNKIEEVETSVNNANTCKKELDNSYTIATTNKENLDTANTLAEKNIEELNSLGNVTDLAKNVQTNTTDIGTLKEDVENNSSQLKDVAHKTGTVQANLNADMIDGIQGNQIPLMTTANITYYVNASTGLDTNDGLTSGTALKTIQKAINLLPQVINHTITINLANGTYNEDLLVSGFLGKGAISIVGNITTPTNCNINSAKFSNNAINISLFGVNLTTTSKDSISIINCIKVIIGNCTITVNTSNNGIFVQGSSAIAENNTISNNTRAITADSMATIFSNTNGGTGNQYGLVSQYGSTIVKYSTQPAGVTNETYLYGGVIR